jgi:hypothetical protein
MDKCTSLFSQIGNDEEERSFTTFRSNQQRNRGRYLSVPFFRLPTNGLVEAMTKMIIIGLTCKTYNILLPKPKISQIYLSMLDLVGRKCKTRAKLGPNNGKSRAKLGPN